jgi:hypothetical protein
MSTLTQQIPSLTDPVERRFYARIIPQVPIFLGFSENGPADSLLLNISENGLLVSTPAGLPRNLVARLSIPLSGLPNPVRVTVRVTWASEEGNLAGIQLLDLTEHDRQQIRKWGAQESTRSPRPEPSHSSLVAPAASSKSSETVGATRISEEDDLFNRATSKVVPLAPPLTIRMRPVSPVARRTILVTAVAAVCLAAAVLFIKAAPGNRFRENDRQSEPAKDIPAPRAAESPNAAAVQLASPITVAGPATAKDAVSDPPPRSSQRIEPASVDLAASGIPTANNLRDDSSREPIASQEAISEATSVPTPSPALMESPTAVEDESVSAPAHATGEVFAAKTSSISPGASSTVPVVPAPSPNLNSPVASPGNPSANAYANPAVTPRPGSSLRPGAPALPPVIQMDAPPTRTLEVRLPSTYQAPFLNLPGERILESPTATVHIQRSVHIPATHAGWPFHHYKKVAVGELISRVDPQPAQIAAGSAPVVKVRATITKEGRLGSVSLILGPSVLVPTVARALQEWRYQPTTVDGKPEQTQCYIVFQFHAPAYPAAKRE